MSRAARGLVLSALITVFLFQLAGSGAAQGLSDNPFAPVPAQENAPGSVTPEAADSTATPPAPVSTAPAPLSEATVTVVCGNCEKEVSVTAANGQKCPHCGIIWDEPIVFPAAPPSPVVGTDEVSGFDFAGEDAAMVQPDGAPRAPARQQQAAGNQVQGDPMQIAPPPAYSDMPQEMNLATLPLWMKAVLFFGALGGCYYVMFYRR